jgi:hypothetical protein
MAEADAANASRLASAYELALARRRARWETMKGPRWGPGPGPGPKPGSGGRPGAAAGYVGEAVPALRSRGCERRPELQAGPRPGPRLVEERQSGCGRSSWLEDGGPGADDQIPIIGGGRGPEQKARCKVKRGEER